MDVDLSLFRLITSASLVVQLVMLLLLAASVASWTVIFSKWRLLRHARTHADGFELRFWSGGDLTRLFEQLRHRRDLAGMEHIFVAGFKEYARMNRRDPDAARTAVENAHRSMRVALSREVDNLDSALSFLATVGSTSPYVGLFGTVWGIMNAFQALAHVQQATLSSVAPGIAEALVATAIGLFAAIPAVIAYNRFSADVDRLVNQYDNFVEEFTALLQRRIHAG